MSQHASPAVQSATLTPSQQFGQWVQTPMGSVITASVATMSTLGVVLSGMWFISALMN